MEDGLDGKARGETGQMVPRGLAPRGGVRLHRGMWVKTEDQENGFAGC